MKKLVLISIVAAALTACGGKAKKPATPENKGGTTTEMKGDGSATGGTTYGGAMKPSSKPTSGGADPCAGQ